MVKIAKQKKSQTPTEPTVAAAEFDVLVIGLGTTGLYAARTLAKVGKRVAAFERGPRGTTCILTGCMPSKALFVPAHHVAHVQIYAQLFENEKNVDGKSAKNKKQTQPQQIDIPKLFLWMREQRADFVKYRLQGEDAGGFARIDGIAELVDKHTVSCNGKLYHGKFIILCTGSRVFVPPIPGLAKAPFFTSDNLFEQKKIDGNSVIVLGGGVIGCEMAQFFNSIGFRVTILARSKPLLRMFDESVSRSLEETFRKRGIDIVFDFESKSVSYDAAKKKFAVADKTRNYVADNLIVSTGRVPNNPKGLDAAGVLVDKNNGRVVRNGFCQTSVRHIYTGGDQSGIQLLHEARQEGDYIAEHILGRTKVAYTSPKLQIAFTYPHIASVGAQEKDLKQGTFLKSVVSFDEGRSIIEGVTEGMMQLLCDLKGNIIGAACVNDYADHLIQSIMPYVQYKMHVSKITDCYHPTQQEVFLDLRDDLLAQLQQPRKKSKSVKKK